MIRNEEIKGKLEFYKSSNVSVHITLYSGKWFNGIIIALEENRVILDEEKLGEHPIYFSEIADIQRRIA
jgi:hypothetical protein